MHLPSIFIRHTGKDMRGIVGIDEVGRGPLAGPITVCAVLWVSEEDPGSVLEGIRDSKKLSPKQRGVWVDKLPSLAGHLQYSIASLSSLHIDKVGVAIALKDVAKKSLASFAEVQYVYADYGIPIPPQHPVTHLIKGDEKHPLIALASIIAKQSRDAEMVSLSKRFSEYGFERNKGYGTAEHISAIKTHGPCAIHRRSFLGRIVG